MYIDIERCLVHYCFVLKPLEVNGQKISPGSHKIVILVF